MTPIRKGSNPVKIPFAIKSTNKTFAAWANETRTAIQQLEARMPTANVGKGAAGGAKPPLWVTISAVPESSPVSYQAKVTTGYVCYQNATLTDSDSGVVGYMTPKIRNSDGELVSIESTGEPGWVAPALPLDGLVNYIYLRVQTDSDGAPKEPTAPEFPGDPGASDGPTIVAFTEPQQSTHHVRPSPSGGEEEGDYYFLICETESNDATPTPAPRVVRRITGNRELPNQLIEIENVEDDEEEGTPREWYKGYQVGPDDKHQIRTAMQLEGRGETIIKPLAAAVDAVPDSVDPDTGQIIPGTPAVPAEEEGDSIKWKRIAERATQPQIHVTSEDDGVVVEIQGNNVYGAYNDPFGGRIDVEDGLVTTILEGDATGADLDLNIYAADINPDGTVGPPSLFITHYWRGGLYVGVANPGVAPAGLITQDVTHLVP